MLANLVADVAHVLVNSRTTQDFYDESKLDECETATKAARSGDDLLSTAEAGRRG
jgi:hypothetical protein